ncbi:MAG: hypothetical protein PHH83_00810 [Patescibacteria group bacterium]|nr:hypothetical protein [Patescibacteria group bacterium]
MSNNEKLDKAQELISDIREGKIKMKPRWYFVLGSVVMVCAFLGLIVSSVFLVSLITFSLRTHGPMRQIRFEQLLNNFPWWAPIIAIPGFVIGILLLKKYDFSYKKNFIVVIIIIFISILLSGFLIDYLGLDGFLMKRGPMRGFYQRYDGGGRMRNLKKQILMKNYYNAGKF